MAKSDRIAWAHLSDFHFQAKKRGRKDYDLDTVLQALLDDLGLFAGKGKPARGAERMPLDFVIITGDVAHSGQPSQYKAAADFLARVQKTTSVPPERMFVVPGNHDVDRAKDVPDPLRESVRGKAPYRKVWRDDKARRLMVEGKLEAYRAFAAKLNPALGTAAAGQAALPPDQPGGFFRRIDCGGRSVALAGLGSSWLGQGGDNDRRVLIAGEDQLFDLAGGVALPELEEADLKLAFMHHPLEWLQDFDREDLERLLASHFDLLLHGHLHRTGLQWQMAPGRQLCAIAAGAAYEGSDYRNAYNIVQVTFGKPRTVKIWLRAYSATSRKFVRDVETYAEADDGTWQWLLDSPKGRRSAARGTTGKGGPRGKAPDRKKAAPDPRPYLEKLKADHQYLDLRGLGAKKAERLELRQVYTRLRAAAPLSEPLPPGRVPGKTMRAVGGVPGRSALAALGKLAGRAPKAVVGGLHEDSQRWSSSEVAPRALELREVMGHHEDVVLVGDPGTGKTTFLHFLALNLARAFLGEDPADALAAIGLVAPAPFPIFVRLGDFGRWLGEAGRDDCPPEAPEHFYRFLDHTQAGFPQVAPGLLRRHVLAGGCLLLLDGLDEVPTEDMRARVLSVVQQVVTAGRRKGNRHVVTCRTRAYRNRAQLEDPFARYNLVDFEDEDVAKFVEQWSRALYHLAPGDTDSEDAAEAARYGRELLAAVRGHPNVRPLTANPLMLTVLGVVHWDRKKLPEQRSELYDAAVEVLLDSRSKQSQYTGTQRRECLQALALAMFEHEAGVQRTLARARAAQVIAPVLGIGQPEALAFLEEEELCSNLLVSRQEGEVEFWHLTFQEYLAALALALSSRLWDVVGPHLFDDRWSELLLLLGGCRRRLDRELAGQFLQGVLDRAPTLPAKARAVGLTGRILRDIAPYGGDAAQGTTFRSALEATLAVFAPGAEPVPESVRIEVGEALGQAGDPRLAVPQANRVFIRGGCFWMGAQSAAPQGPNYDPEAFGNESPVRRVRLSDFWVGRYPVTVQEYRQFVDAKSSGYLDRRWWTPEGWTWRAEKVRLHPHQWRDQILHPNWPVTWITWFEAAAFARWAGGQLPSEAQWEYTARGAEARRFPWGNQEPTDGHANFGMHVGRPTPVGIYPLGHTPEGVVDLAGGVWEWCRDSSETYPDAEAMDPVIETDAPVRVLRGGSFSYDPRGLRAAYRYRFDAGSGGGLIGFRCVWSAAGGQ